MKAVKRFCTFDDSLRWQSSFEKGSALVIFSLSRSNGPQKALYEKSIEAVLQTPQPYIRRLLLLTRIGSEEAREFAHAGITGNGNDQ